MPAGPSGVKRRLRAPTLTASDATLHGDAREFHAGLVVKLGHVTLGTIALMIDPSLMR